MLLVDENRQVHKHLKPLKETVLYMEQEGLIEVYDKEIKREYMKLADKKIPLPLIWLCQVTDKGNALL